MTDTVIPAGVTDYSMILNGLPDLTVIEARWNKASVFETYIKLPAPLAYDRGETDNWLCLDDSLRWDISDVLDELRIISTPDQKDVTP